MRRVLIESPYRATEHFTVEQHLAYLKEAMADCIRKGDSPFASHHLIPGILDDDTPYERALGIRCGLVWGECADYVAIYSDFGISPGMKQSLMWYKSIQKPIEWRTLDYRIVRRIKGIGVENSSSTG